MSVEFYSAWGVDHYFDELPAELRIVTNDYDEFQKKAEALLEMDDCRYIGLSKDPGNTIISMPFPSYPHEVIRTRIATHIRNIKSAS